ncbi:hypothetical protein EDD18DRAFT_1310769 [Armillaria luteobubalina]|uniref:Uncharacterized protein n=1 Tax=Armillaria luteobubalina TaxID=153913 RepID=A0AA39PYK8_9AGAR|nr:hypothetical protein EDD18DRAFT_1310769 [Armillaria luteobubalina]
MGTKRDLSNRQRNARVDSEQRQHEVEMNAFSEALLPLGFNYYQMLVPDLMHESESGGWKSLFTHLVRICYEIPGAIQRLNKRNDVSGQKKFAARDYEDVLQCSIPCFDGLLPDSKDNSVVMDTLFAFATWHAFAKARMHTESSIEALHGSVKAFNLLTYKNHALGDYVWTIPMFGTTDSYSTQIGEQEHHRVKLFYARTNKHGHVKQIAILEHRRMSTLKTRSSKKTISPRISPNEKDPLPKGDPENHYQMSLSRSYPLDLHQWLAENEGDLAIADFIPKLKEHILHRLFVYEIDLDDEITAEQLSSETTHPYWYGRIIGLFHADVRYNDPHGNCDHEDRQVFRVDFAWVRWYGFDSSHRSGFAAKRPHHVGFVDGRDPGAFGFLDPDDIIHAVHLLPVYRLGQTAEFLPPSIARRPEENDQDYERYSVDMYVT